MHLLETGQHVVIVDDVYGGTQRYFRRVAKPTYNIDFTFVDFNDPQALRNAFQPGKTKLVWLETPTNPTLKVSNVAATAALCKEMGALFVVDNTFLSPYFQNPLDLGADVVVHSVTKYIGGHRSERARERDRGGGWAEPYGRIMLPRTSTTPTPSAFSHHTT